MAHGFAKIRKGHSHQKRDSCASGGFYKSPSAGEVISTTKQLNISWDTSCMNTTAVDIYLYAPDAESPRIHEWERVNFGYGSYNATLQPTWWNSTASVRLQLAIVKSGTPTFLSTLPAGPVFNVSYSGGDSSDAGSESASGTVTEVDNLPSTSHGLSKGKVAAAVLVTLLVVIGIAVGVYVKRSRGVRKDKQRRFSIAVDKRMSTISSEWKSVTPAGATAAIRNSMMVGDAERRPSSSFSFGGIRPSSTFAIEGGGQAGIGVWGVQMAEQGGSAVDLTAPHMAQLRPGLRTSTFSAADRASRVSRVSFAPDTRPSSEYRRTRAFHSEYVPPLPDAHTRDPGEMSPTQAEGPISLTVEDIRARMSVHESGRRSSVVDGMMSALSMMRTDSRESDMLLPAASGTPSAPSFPLPTLPASARQSLTSPVMGVMAMQPMPPSVMSPDDMLRAYAERSLRSPPPGGPAAPAPAANFNSSGMRTLYSPSLPPVVLPSTAPMMPMAPSPDSLYLATPQPNARPAENTYRASFAPTEESRYGEENVELGTAK